MLGALLAVAVLGGTPDIHKAINKGDMGAFKLALGAGADVNAKGPLEQTPLMRASLKGRTEMVKHLLGI